MTDWQMARCLGMPTRWWYAKVTNEAGRQQRASALARCGVCPIRDACLDAALVEEKELGPNNRPGIRGGLSGQQRYRISAERGLTKPRKNWKMPS